MQGEFRYSPKWISFAAVISSLCVSLLGICMGKYGSILIAIVLLFVYRLAIPIACKVNADRNYVCIKIGTKTISIPCDEIVNASCQMGESAYDRIACQTIFYYEIKLETDSRDYIFNDQLQINADTIARAPQKYQQLLDNHIFTRLCSYLRGVNQI